MKKLIFLVSFVYLTSLIGNSQVYEIKTKTNNPDAKEQSVASIKKQVYYFKDLLVDESIFEKDTLILSKERTNIKPAKLEILEDSSFVLHYDVNIDTIKKSDKESGLMIDIIVENSKKINGTWKTNNIQTDLTLIFQDEKSIDYSIVDKNGSFYFIRLD